MSVRVFAVALLAGGSLGAQTVPLFEVEEATIAQIHDAMRDRRLTCRGLVDAYIRRINAYDKNGPAINAIVTINPGALQEADEMDHRFAQSGLIGPLHCVPMIVKDNFETKGLQTSNGALAFAGYLPSEDASQAARVKAAGAIVLAKSNMAEWAFSPVETVSSILPGYTKNPYALDRVTAGRAAARRRQSRPASDWLGSVAIRAIPFADRHRINLSWAFAPRWGSPVALACFL